MRVKRLEVQGFKSFKDKTVIHFDQSITGIVGPNGCGKSNIVDAFFWVMGEMSYKHIRGRGSDDLIFNGSSKYPQLGLAEATLVLETDVADTENSPAGASFADLPVKLKHKEVSVTRRVYRGGEGEYFINGQLARLKDIRELFMDTGVGTKGYSVIEQGQIGRIVNSKPEERRTLVEDAAGIAKYKARKQESIRKLESARANLGRLNDVVKEIERTMNSLERQAAKARKYNEYKKELFDKEMTWGRQKFRLSNQKLTELKEAKEQAEQELISSRSELQTLENDLESMQLLEAEVESKAEELQPVIQQIASDLSHEQSALNLSHRRQEDLEKRIEEMTTERQELHERIEAEKLQLAEKETELESSDQEFSSCAEKAELMEGQVREVRTQTESKRREIDEIKGELMRRVAEASELVSKNAGLQSRLESCNDRLRRLHDQKDEIEKRSASLSRSKVTVGQRYSEFENESLRMGEQLKQDENRLETLKETLEQSRNTKEEVQSRLAQFESKLQSLEDLDKAFEGLAHAPKAVMEWARDNSKHSVLGLLADAFDVQSGFEKMMDAWLGARLDTLCTTNLTTAVESFEHLKSSKSGRATIIALEGQPDRQTAMDYDAFRQRLYDSGVEVIGRLSDSVSVNENQPIAMAPLAHQVVANVCLVDSLAPALRLIEAEGLGVLGGWSLVSREGEVIESNGVLRGGSIEVDQTAHILARRTAIRDLEENVQTTRAEYSSAVGELNRIESELESCRNEIQQLREERSEVEIEKQSASRELEQISRQLHDLEEDRNGIEAESESLGSEILSAESEIEMIRSTLEEHETRKTELENSAESGDLQLSEQEKGLQAQEEELRELRVAEASIREKVQGLRREIEVQKGIVKGHVNREEELIRLLERIRGEKDEHSGGDDSIREKIEELTRLKAEREEQLREFKDEVGRSRAKLRESQDRLRELRQGIEKLSSSSHDQSLEIERITSDIAHLTQNLEEKYGPGCLERAENSPEQVEMEEPVVTREMTEEEERQLNEEVEQLRERIRRLGEVNPMAVEEYELEQKRHEDLTTQRTDLEQSIENLEAAIEHINRTSEDRFRKAFESIADRFEKLFPIIFGGGKARLSLVYPEGSENILDAGIDIMAQPPGKNIVSINVLSGGEKALTALALVFGIFMVKPSPFCILDEVDAPLDDTNIGKFNTLLKEMAEKTQFILITHNKKTMELNDTLYGVTMEEPGVSKMVSIQMQ